jgi:uncharacterized protein
MMKNKILTVFVQALVLAMCVMVNSVSAAEKAQELEWTDLMPKGYNPDDLVEEYQKKYNIADLSDDDPVVKEMMKKMDAMLKSSPLNTELNGKFIKLPGYVIPLETDGQKSSEFLLVPYFGACIHVPPPPANQTVYVKTQDKKGAAIRKLYDVVWVTGIITASKQTTDLADAGYTISASKVEPYE